MRMSFLSFLFGKKKTLRDSTSKTEAKPPIPTVKARRDVEEEFLASLRLHLSSLGHLSNSEINGLLSVVEKSPNFFADQHAWQSVVYEKFFAGREWVWPLLEEWRAALIKHKVCNHEVLFALHDINDLNFSRVVNRLRVADIKTILKQAEVVFNPKAKKDELADMLEKNISIEWLDTKSDIWKDVKAETSPPFTAKEKAKWEQFLLLLTNAKMTAENRVRVRDASEAGLSKMTYMFRSGNGSKDLAAKIAKKMEGEIPPFFPGDLTALRPDLSSFKTSAIGEMPKLQVSK